MVLLPVTIYYFLIFLSKNSFGDIICIFLTRAPKNNPICLLYACSMDVDFCFLTVLSRLLMYIFMGGNFDQEENDSHFFGKELYGPSMGADRSILVSAP